MLKSQLPEFCKYLHSETGTPVQQAALSTWYQMLIHYWSSFKLSKQQRDCVTQTTSKNMPHLNVRQCISSISHGRLTINNTTGASVCKTQKTHQNRMPNSILWETKKLKLLLFFEVCITFSGMIIMTYSQSKELTCTKWMCLCHMHMVQCKSPAWGALYSTYKLDCHV